jgi:predicted nucleic acid-binding protein
MERIRLKPVVVCDAGPIIHLDELGCLSLLNDFENVFVPYRVREEVLKHRQIRFEKLDEPWVVLSPIFPLEESLKSICKMFSLDVGEVEALSILNKEPEAIFLTDDSAARLVAAQLGFKVHGSIGVLIRAIRRGLMKPAEVIDVLNAFPLSSTLHIKISLLEEVISRLKQEYGL